MHTRTFARAVRLGVCVPLLLIHLSGAPASAAEVTRVAPYDAGRICYIQSDNFPFPDGEVRGGCSYWPSSWPTATPYLELIAQDSLASPASNGYVTVGGWDYIWLPGVATGYFFSVYFASTTAYFTAQNSGTLTIDAAVRGAMGGVPNFFVRNLHACLVVRDPTGSSYALATDCLWKGDTVRNLSVTHTVATGDVVRVEFFAENTQDVGAAALELSSLTFRWQ